MLRAGEKKARLNAPVRIPVGAAILCVLVAIGLGTAFGVGRSSSSYIVAIDAVTSGGGQGASASYAEADGAVGQGLPCGPSASAGYRNQAGVVQAWRVAQPSQSNVGAETWQLFE